MSNDLVFSVVGQGYVGLPLTIELAKISSKVFAIDTNDDLIQNLNKAETKIEGINKIDLKALVDTGRFLGTTSFEGISDSKFIFICVPTPIDSNRKPDLTYLISAVESVAKYISPNSIIIIESTIEPGTTRNVIVPLIENVSGLSRDNFEIAFSPERIDPANSNWNITNTPKIVSGYTEETAEKVREIYSLFIDEVFICKSLEVAEMAKLLENSFRLVNISFINEISKVCRKIGIDVNDVINAASTKPFGFMPFYPSVGIGGHCIPVDPLYLVNMANEIGVNVEMIKLADEINNELPGFFVSEADHKIGGLKGKRVLVIGVSYKPNVSDVRETPVKALVDGLKSKGAKVFWHDNYVKVWNGEESTALSENFDLAIIATPHDYLDLSKLGKVKVLNTRSSI
jgi:UDP-N-acetyl-D-glucosamine dehydrogenase